MNFPLFRYSVKRSCLLWLVCTALMCLYAFSVVRMYDPDAGKAMMHFVQSQPHAMELLGMTQFDNTFTAFIVNYLYGMLLLALPMLFTILLSVQLIAALCLQRHDVVSAGVSQFPQMHRKHPAQRADCIAAHHVCSGLPRNHCSVRVLLSGTARSQAFFAADRLRSGASADICRSVLLGVLPLQQRRKSTASQRRSMYSVLHAAFGGKYRRFAVVSALHHAVYLAQPNRHFADQYTGMLTAACPSGACRCSVCTGKPQFFKKTMPF